ncbi:hypothetical protein HC823_00890 [Candidatus Gracilibacteria bacterium]|nr:hypothetical protein [Candidatus Gracilibacteria bacterium]
MKKLLGIGLLLGTLFLMTGCGSRTEISSQKLQQGAEILAQAKQAADDNDWVLSESKLREVLTLFPKKGYENERISALKVLISVLKNKKNTMKRLKGWNSNEHCISIKMIKWERRMFGMRLECFG